MKKLAAPFCIAVLSAVVVFANTRVVAKVHAGDLVEIEGGTAQENADHIRGLLNGTRGPRRDAVAGR